MNVQLSLLGIPIARSGLDEAVAECEEDLAVERGGYFCFVNVHTLTESATNMALRSALLRATRCYADGMPLVWLAKLKRDEIRTRVSGPDFMDAMLRRGGTHGFIGGAPGRAEAVKRRYKLDGVVYSPPMREFSEAGVREDWETFLSLCDGKPPRRIWIGLGAPKQELWLATVSRLAPDVMFFGVGAAFDFLAGAKSRAPLLLQRLGLEWTHRLATEPRRLWKRYLIANLRFVALAVRELNQ